LLLRCAKLLAQAGGELRGNATLADGFEFATDTGQNRNPGMKVDIRGTFVHKQGEQFFKMHS